MNRDISEQLAPLRLSMSDDTAYVQLSEIHRELRSPGAPARRAGHRPVRRVVIATIAAAALLLPAAAIASDDAVPGEVLYPVKRAVEWPWSLVDADVRPTHRVEELEAAIEGNAALSVIRARLRDAEDVVGDGSGLTARLERARNRIRAHYGDQYGADGSQERPGDAGLGGRSGPEEQSDLDTSRSAAVPDSREEMAPGPTWQEQRQDRGGGATTTSQAHQGRNGRAGP